MQRKDEKISYNTYLLHSINMDSHRALVVISIFQTVLLTLLLGYLGALHLEGAKTLNKIENLTQDIQVAQTFGFLQQAGIIQGVLSNMTDLAENISYRVAISLMKRLIEPV